MSSRCFCQNTDAIHRFFYFSSFIDVDVVGGAEKYTRMLCELFFRLKNHPGLFGSWLTTLLKEHGEDDVDHLTSDELPAGKQMTVDDTNEKRSTLEEPDDSSGLL